MAAGFTLADIPKRVTWRAVEAFARASRPGSAFYAVASDEDSPWPRSEQLTAYLIDAINHLGWLYLSAHSDTTPERPQPFPRPGIEPVEDDKTQHIGSDPIPADEFNDWWQSGGG